MSQISRRVLIFLDVIQSLEQSEAQFFQDIFCLLLNGGKRNGFFVEFGACDGLLISNTHLLETKFGWSGILSEPARTWHDALRLNRSCTVDTRCVWKEIGRSVKFEESSLSDRSSIVGVEHDTGEISSRYYNVETISLDDLLKVHDAPKHIDLLSIDVEGAELEILKAFPFDTRTFGFMCIEHHSTELETAIKRILEEVGYRQVLRSVSGYDGFYVPESTIHELSY